MSVRKMRVFALLCCVSSVARADSTWRWEIESGGGTRDRFFLVFEGAPPTERKVREWWTLDVRDDVATLKIEHESKPEQVKRFSLRNGLIRAEGSSKWLPLVTRRVPPRVLSMERVPCSSPLFPGLEATCSGKPGGPLDEPELPTFVVVSSGGLGPDLITGALAVMTMGAVIPGDRNRHVVAALTSPNRAPPRGIVAEWKNGRRTVDERSLDAETAGALVMFGGFDAPQLNDVVSRVPPLDRHSVLRLAAARTTRLEDVLQVIAVQRLPAVDDELRASLVSHFYGRLKQGAEGLLRGEMPELQRALASSFGKERDGELLKSLESGQLAKGEGAVLASMLSSEAFTKAASRFMEHIPVADGVELLRERYDVDLAPTLNSMPAWTDRAIDAGNAEQLFDRLHTEGQLLAVLEGSLTRANETQRVGRLRFAMSKLHSEAARLNQLRKWNATSFTVEQRASLVNTMRFIDGYRDAVALLFDGPEFVNELLKTAKDERRVQFLLEKYQPAIDVETARAAFVQLQFDNEKLKGGPLLIAAVPPADAPELFVVFTKQFLSDSARLEFIRSAPQLTKAQRAAVLRSFKFDREKAKAVLK